MGLSATVAGGILAPVWLLGVGLDRPEFAHAPSASGLTVIRADAPAHRLQSPRAATRSTAPALVSLQAAAAPVFRRHAPAAGAASHHAAHPAHALRAAAPRPAPKPDRPPAPSPPPPPAPAPAPPTPPSAPPAPPSPSVGSVQLASLVPTPTTPVPPRVTGTPVTHALSGSDPAAYWTPEQMRDAQPAPMGIPGGHSTTTTDPAPQPPAGGQHEVTNSPSASDPAAYWTPKRIRDTQPAPMGIPGGHSTTTTDPAPQPPPPLGGQDEEKYGTPLGQSDETPTQNTDAKGAGKANSPPRPFSDSTSAASPGPSATDQGSETGAMASNGSVGGNGKGKK